MKILWSLLGPWVRLFEIRPQHLCQETLQKEDSPSPKLLCDGFTSVLRVIVLLNQPTSTKLQLEASHWCCPVGYFGKLGNSFSLHDDTWPNSWFSDHYIPRLGSCVDMLATFAFALCKKTLPQEHCRWPWWFFWNVQVRSNGCSNHRASFCEAWFTSAEASFEQQT